MTSSVSGVLGQHTPGHRYLLSFDYSPRNFNLTSNQMQVVIDGQLVIQVQSPFVYWVQKEVEVTAQSSTMRVEFIGAGESDGYGALLDNVKLVPLNDTLDSENLISNPSFELHDTAYNTFKLFSELGAWKTKPMNEPVSFEIQGNISGIINAQNGVKKAELDGAQNSSLYQEVSTSVGSSYTLKVHYTPRVAGIGTSNEVLVFINEELKATLYNTTVGWREYTVSFDASSTKTKIELKASGASDGLGGLIDNLSFKESGVDQNLLVNGSFENTPPLSGQNWGLFKEIEGWKSGTYTQTLKQLEIQYGKNIGDYEARDGESKLELDSDSNASVYHDVPTQDGQAYVLSFSYTPRVLSNSSTNQVLVKWNDVDVIMLNGTQRGWKDYAFSVPGRNGTSRLEFIGSGTSDGYGGLIDLVTLKALIQSHPPVAALGCSIQNMLVSCNTQGSYDVDNDTLSYTFDFGDGATETNSSGVATHAYQTPGLYQVVVTVRDSSNLTGQATTNVQAVLAQNVLPVAQLNCTSTITNKLTCDPALSTDSDGSIVTFQYLFDDNTSETRTNNAPVTHTFSTPGDHAVTLLLTDNDGGQSSVTRTYSVKANAAPIAQFTCLSNTLFNVQCSSNSSDPDAPNDFIQTLSWNFGDGTIVSGQEGVSHTYVGGTTAEVSLTVSDSFGATSTFTQSVNLKQNSNPVAQLNCTTNNLLVQCNGLSSYDADQQSLSYHFDYGDGFAETVTDGVSSHAFANSGLSIVTLTVTDSMGGSDSIQTTVMPVRPPNVLPVAQITCSSSSPRKLVCSPVNSYDPDGTILSYKYFWDAEGPETYGSVESVSHIFPSGGAHSVTLVVTDNDGGEGSVTTSYIVKENTTPVAAMSCEPNYLPNKIRCQSISTDKDEADFITTYRWTFSNGAVVEGSAFSEQTFTAAGPISVGLEVTDTFGAVSQVTRNFVILDQGAPELSFQFPTGQNFAADEGMTFWVKIEDDEPLVPAALVLTINGVRVGSSYLTLDTTLKKLTAVIPPSTYTVIGQNTVTATLTSSTGTLTTASVLYNVSDTSAPTFAATPLDGFHFSTQTGSAEIRITDPSGIDWSTLSVKLQGEDLAAELYRVEDDKVILDINSGNLISPEDNNFTFSVKDINGNQGNFAFTYWYDRSPLRFDFIPGSDSVIDDNPGQASVFAVLDEPGPINWASLKVYWNGVEQPSTSYVVTEEKVSLDLDFGSARQGTLKVSILDADNKLVTGEATYRLKDQNPPVLAFSEPEDFVFSNTLSPEVIITATDDSALNWSSAQLILNGQALPSNQYTVDRTGNRILLQLSDDFSVFVGPNQLEVSLADVEGNLAQAQHNFSVVDIEGPRLAFLPQIGTSFLSNTTNLAISVKDLSNINWSSLRIDLNGVPVPIIYRTISKNTILLRLNPDFSMELGENHLDITLSDVWGNLTSTSATYYLLDKRAPDVAFSPDSGTNFNAYDQAISVRFNSPEKVNFSTVAFNLNGVQVASNALPDGVSYEVILSQAAGMIQDLNTLTVSYNDLSGVNYKELSYYTLADLMGPVLSVTPANNFQFSSQAGIVNITASDASGVDWDSLKLVLNGATIGKDRVSIQSNTANVSLNLRPGTNSLNVSVADKKRLTTSLTRTYTVKDTLGPVIAFSPRSWSVFSSGQAASIVANISDGTGVNPSSIQVWFNGVSVPLGVFTWNASEGKLSLPFTGSQRLTAGANSVRIRAADTLGQVAESVAAYTLIDTAPSQIAFVPAAGQIFINNKSPAIRLEFLDEGDMNFSSIQVMLNGVLVPAVDLTVDQLANAVIVHLSSVNLVRGSNELAVSIADAAGNLATANSLYTLIDSNEPTVAAQPASGETFNGLDQTIVFTFSDLTELNWGTLEFKLGDEEIPETHVVRSGNSVAVSFDEEVRLQQGANQVSLSVEDTSGNSLVRDFSYNLSDIFPADFDFSPISGTTITANDPTIGINVSDLGTLDWTTLSLTLNGRVLPTSQYTRQGQSVTTALSGNNKLRTGLNIFEISLSDVAGNVGQGTAAYVYNPANTESIRPTISFSLANAELAQTPSSILATLTDASGIDFDRVQVSLNGAVVPEERVTKNISASTILISFDSTFKLQEGQNILTVLAADKFGNLGGKSGFYKLNTNLPGDLTPPVVTFNPAGGQLVNNTPTIHAFFSDASGVDFGSIVVNLNGSTLPSNMVAIDPNQRKLTLAFTSGFSLPDQQSNTIAVTVADVKGNFTTARVGFDRQSDTTFKVVSYEGTVDLTGRTACTVLEGGVLRCWGGSAFGATGQGYTDGQGPLGVNYTPNQVSAVQLPEPAVSVATGFHTCMISTTGKVMCWGLNASGQLGYGNTNNIGDNELPITQGFMTLDEKAIQVAVGNDHTCVILESGAVRCWGSNQFGQIGQVGSSNIGDNELPTSVAVLPFTKKAISIACSQFNTCVAFEDGTVKCFGQGARGVNGYSSTANTLGQNVANLANVSLSGSVKSVSANAGSNHVCALLNDGRINCWGLGSSGQLGYGNAQTVGDNELPSSRGTVSLGGTVKKIALGQTHTCAIMSNGDLRCWGSGNVEQNGYAFNVGDDELPSSVQPLNFGTGTLADIQLGSNLSCIILTNGTLKCWGQNGGGILGQGTTTNISFASVANLPAVNLGGNILLGQSIYAYFTVNPYFGPSPLLVEFDGSSSLTASGSIINYAFNFGDGSSANSSTGLLTHIYAQDGVYQATLTVTNSAGDNSTFTRTLTVGANNNPPFAQFNILQDFGTAPMTAQFDGSTSFDVNGTLSSYTWDYGDNSQETLTNAQATHLYQNPGQYVVMLTVQDNQGATANSIPQVVTVKSFNMEPSPTFTCTRSGKTVTCDARLASDLDGYISNYSWAFGDGEVLSGANMYIVSHTYVDEGDQSVTLTVTDNSGATAEQTKSVSVDSISPIISSTTADNVLTRATNFSLNVSVDEQNLEETKLYRGTELLYTTSQPYFDRTVSLVQGLNTFVVEARDFAGNVARKTILKNVVLDTVAPTLISQIPAAGSHVTSTGIVVKGTFSEPVVSAELDGEPVVLASDGLSFTQNYFTYTDGEKSLGLAFTDRAGNNGTADIEFNVLFPVLNKELVAVTIHPEGNLRVYGAPGAAKPNVEIEVYATILNNGSTTSASDGSFELITGYFTEASLTATDQATNRTATMPLVFNADTTLSGTVQDTEGNPLPGVVVSIKNTNSSSGVTNSQGIFVISNPPVGDQQLVIDAQRVPANAVGMTKKFSILELPVTIGARERNVLEKVIHLAPLLIDGTETVIESGVAYTVESANVEGAKIEIPSDVNVTFPDGSPVNAINMVVVDKDRTTVPVPSVAEPESVIALEPSGLTFSDPVELTLSNENEFPSGMQLVIYSKNSANGKWEIDGLAKVSEDGEKIVTEPGQGITHFSEVYAAPMGLKYSRLNSEDKPGVDTVGGAVTTSIDFPGYRSLGSEISPKLLYKSNWAYPTAIANNIFEIPENVIFVNSDGVRKVRPAENELGYVKTWIVPERVDVSYIAGDYQSPVMSLTGSLDKAVVSLGVDLSSQPSGIVPFAGNYEIHLKRMIVRTKVVPRGGLFNQRLVVKEGPPQAEGTEVIPSELRSQMYVQNKSQSPVGHGWMIGGVQRIVNPVGARLMIEEEDGSVSTYVVNDKIQTLANFSEGISGFAALGNDRFSVASSSDQVFEVDVTDTQASSLLTAPTYSGVYRSSNVISRRECTAWTKNGFGGKICVTMGNRPYCQQKSANYQLRPTRKYVIKSPSSNGYLVASESGVITLHQDGSFTRVAGRTKSSPTSDNNALFCAGEAACSGRRTVNDFRSNSCPTNPVGAGAVPLQGASDGVATSATFNTIKSIAASPVANQVAIADFGNNKIRLLNLTTNQVSTIAGNGQTNPTISGSNALETSLLHPQGVAYDYDGNLYVLCCPSTPDTDEVII